LLSYISSTASCTTETLRKVNVLALAATVLPALKCRQYIFKERTRNQRFIYSEAVHTAINICLFPPLFFFSGMYYTDVLSTLVVVGAYGYFLKCGRVKIHPVLEGIGTYGLGVASLLMRQTNIFWVAVFLAALSWVRTCKAHTTFKAKKRHGEQSIIRDLGDKLDAYSHGLLHDPKLGDAGVAGVLQAPI
jgi:alpha-1,2-glucosyltransferase